MQNVYLFYLFFRKLKSDTKKHNNLENKSKSILQEKNKLIADIDHTNTLIKKHENSIKQEQKKVKFKIDIIFISYNICLTIWVF